MAKSDLLKEAIADAKAVKETALANAKIALEEAFAPRIQSMLSTKLAEDEMYEHDAEYAEDEGMEQPDAFDAGEDPAAVDDLAAAMGGAEGDEGFEAEISAGPSTVTIDGVDYAPTRGGEGGEGEFDAEAEIVTDTGALEDYGEEESDDLELESIIRELEEDLDNSENEAYQDLTTEARGEKAGDESDTDPGATDYSGKGMRKGDESDTHKGLDEASWEETDAQHIDDLEKDINYDKDESADFNIDEIIESILSEEDDEDIIDQAEVEVETESVEKLKEAYSTINSLRYTINEVNLLNAKLLYTNKLFRNFELSENQKMTVIENFDRAGNTREVKLVFSTLAESFKMPKGTKRRIVKEGRASKSSTTTAPTKRIINEGNELANRWKKLAGLLD